MSAYNLRISTYQKLDDDGNFAKFIILEYQLTMLEYKLTRNQMMTVNELEFIILEYQLTINLQCWNINTILKYQLKMLEYQLKTLEY